jgi:hypothetical protein
VLHLAKSAVCGKLCLFVLVNVVGVAEWSRHLVVAQKTVGSNPTAHPLGMWQPILHGLAVLFTRLAWVTYSFWIMYLLSYDGRNVIADDESFRNGETMPSSQP